MFQFSGLASHAYLIQHAIIQGPWDQRSFDNSPKLFAAYHALHRLLSPRHPPHALCNLTTMICGSLTRTQTLQLRDKCVHTHLPMQFENYVVAELSKINANPARQQLPEGPRQANLRDGESKPWHLDGQATASFLFASSLTRHEYRDRDA